MDDISRYIDEGAYEKICKKYDIPMIYRSELDNRELFWYKVNTVAKAYVKMNSILDKAILARIYGGVRNSAKVQLILEQLGKL